MKQKKDKGFFAEFRKFISRGNVMDMAVGTIIGAAFTAIVTALSNGILKPLINTIIYYLCGGNADALSKMYTPLVKVMTTNESGEQILDLTKSIYIDWGAFISAIINFLLIALVLFCILKAFNKAKDASESSRDALKRIAYKQEKGYKLTKKEMEILAEHEKAEAEAAEKAAKEQAEAEAAEAAAQAKVAEKEAREVNTEKLLMEIRDLLKNK